MNRKVLVPFAAGLLIVGALQVEPVRYAAEPAVDWVEAVLLNRHQAPLSNAIAGKWISRNDFQNYLLQSRAASQHGLPLIENQEIHDRLVAEGRLIRLPVRGNGYRIKTNEIVYSSPYFSERMLEAFEDLTTEWARRMREAGFRRPRVVISSGTRTVPQQKNIAKEHSGATKRISAHSYGAAMDLIRIEYFGKAGQEGRDEARALLKECLNDSEAFFWVPEGSNFHITAKPKP